MRLASYNGIPIELRNSDGSIVCPRCIVASRPLRRLRGLLGRRGLRPGEGVLLSPAASVHTFFMRFPIDVVFLDDDLVVVGVAPGVGPWRARGRRGARHVLELAAGEATRAGLAPAVRLSVDAAGGDARDGHPRHVVA